MKLVCIVVIAIGCGERAKLGAESGSGSAPATAAARDAQPVDAAPSAAGDAGVDAAAAVDPKIAARLPIEPIFLATAGGSIVIAKLDRSGLHPTYDGRDDGRDANYFAWVDAHTLIAFHDGSAIDAPSLVHRFVDGVEAKTIEVAPRDWGPVKELKSTPQLLATRGGEAWLTACLREGKTVNEAEGPPCTRRRYLRVHPAPRQIRDKPPAGVEPGRSTGPFDVVPPWPKAPDAAAPAGFRVKLAPVAIAADYQPAGSPPRRFRGVVCESPKRKNTYPNATFDQAYDHVSGTVRWMQTTPPIYEITGVMTTPVEVEEAEWIYLRACDDERLAGFYALGNGVWAERVDPPDPAPERWILRVDDIEIGSLPGNGALRASRLIPPNSDR